MPADPDRISDLAPADLHPRDEACIHCAAPARLASPDPVIDCPREECPMPRPAVVDPTACTCRPLLRGVDVNPGCPSHGRQK